MHSLGVAGAAQEHTVHAERHTADADATFHSSAKFVNLGSVAHIENPDHGALFASCRNSRSFVTESQRCQRTIVSCDHGFRMLKREKALGKNWYPKKTWRQMCREQILQYWFRSKIDHKEIDVDRL